MVLIGSSRYLVARPLDVAVVSRTKVVRWNEANHWERSQSCGIDSSNAVVEVGWAVAVDDFTVRK